jgi:hypothetical protein
MTKSTANSDYPNLPAINGAGEKVIINVEDPNADLQLDEEELNEIFSRP